LRRLEVLLAALEDIAQVDPDLLLFAGLVLPGDRDRPLFRPLGQAARVGDRLEQGDPFRELGLDRAGPRHPAHDEDPDLLVDRHVDDVARLDGDVQGLVAVDHEVIVIDGDGLGMAIRALAQDEDLVAGRLAETAGHGDDLKEVLAADELVVAGLFHRPDDGHLLILVFLDEDRDLGILDVLGAEELGELLDDAVLGQALDDDAAEQGQGDRAVLRDADGLLELLDLEDLDLEKVARADAIRAGEGFFGRLGRGGGRLGLGLRRLGRGQSGRARHRQDQKNMLPHRPLHPEIKPVPSKAQKS
jgi:hypothetical protein